MTIRRATPGDGVVPDTHLRSRRARPPSPVWEDRCRLLDVHLRPPGRTPIPTGRGSAWPVGGSPLSSSRETPDRLL